MNADVMSFTYAQFQMLIIIIVRVAALFMIAPVLGHARVPVQVKAGLVLIFSLLLLLTIKAELPARATQNILGLAGILVGEVFIGVIIGYTAYLWFTGIQMAGQIIDIQVGFGLVNIVDPSTNSQVSILGQFYYILALLFFLAINGHHYLLKAVADSFSLIPPGNFTWLEHAASAGPYLAKFFSQLFLIAFQVAAPVIATLFLTNLTMGLLSRTIPQMNVFIVGLPLNIMVGLGITIISLKLLGGILETVVKGMSSGITRMLFSLAA